MFLFQGISFALQKTNLYSPMQKSLLSSSPLLQSLMPSHKYDMGISVPDEHKNVLFTPDAPIGEKQNKLQHGRDKAYM